MGMIELIFAIVVMSIAMLAIPAIMMQTSSNINEAIKQEAIFQAYRTIGTILTYKWDDKSVIGDDTNTSHILDTTSSEDELNRTNAGSVVRIGNFYVTNRRTFFSSTRYASTPLGLESGETQEDDIDDFDGHTDSITAAPGEYAFSFNLTSSINYISDNNNYSQSTLNFTLPLSPSSSTTSIKLIELNVTDTDGNSILILRAFSCNIGELPAPLKKDAY